MQLLPFCLFIFHFVSAPQANEGSYWLMSTGPALIVPLTTSFHPFFLVISLFSLPPKPSCQRHFISRFDLTCESGRRERNIAGCHHSKASTQGSYHLKPKRDFRETMCCYLKSQLHSGSQNKCKQRLRASINQMHSPANGVVLKLCGMQALQGKECPGGKYRAELK